jgi:hypothetical protein
MRQKIEHVICFGQAAETQEVGQVSGFRAGILHHSEHPEHGKRK